MNYHAEKYSSDLMIFIMFLEEIFSQLYHFEYPIALTVAARYQHLLHHCSAVSYTGEKVNPK